MKKISLLILTLLSIFTITLNSVSAQEYFHTRTFTGHKISVSEIAFKDDSTLISVGTAIVYSAHGMLTQVRNAGVLKLISSRLLRSLSHHMIRASWLMQAEYFFFSLTLECPIQMMGTHEATS